MKTLFVGTRHAGEAPKREKGMPSEINSILKKQNLMRSRRALLLEERFYGWDDVVRREMTLLKSFAGRNCAMRSVWRVGAVPTQGDWHLQDTDFLRCHRHAMLSEWQCFLSAIFDKRGEGWKNIACNMYLLLCQMRRK